MHPKIQFFSAFALFFFFHPGVLPALSPLQSPAEEQWLTFMEFNPGKPTLPEDEKMGLLADRRNPDPLWASALETCERAFESIRKGMVPVDELYSDVRVPLSLDFSRVLSEGGKKVSPRYALPRRDGKRISIELRLNGGETSGYGFIYLTRLDGEWFIDQWMLDLSVYPYVEKTEEISLQ